MERVVYLVLGSRGGGRASIVVDLIDFGLDSQSASQVFFSVDDANEWGGELPIRHTLCEQGQYPWGGLNVSLTLDATSERVFVVADGLSNPADFVEAFYDWLKDSPYELGRVITNVDCYRVSEERKLLQWYDCCIHFSDVVLLGNRMNVSNKWIVEFKNRYLKEYYPCLFVFVKKGRLPNPSLILEPEARRISKLFDEPDELSFIDDDVEIEDSGDPIEEEEEEEAFEGGDPSKDPFLAKMANGRRNRTLPTIADILP